MIADKQVTANVVLRDDVHLIVEQWAFDGRERVVYYPWSKLCSDRIAYPCLEGKYVRLMGKSRFAAVRFDVNDPYYELIQRPGEIGQDVDGMFHLFMRDGLYNNFNGRFWYMQSPGDPWNVVDLPIICEKANCHVNEHGSLLCYKQVMRLEIRDHSFSYYERIEGDWIERRASLPSNIWKVMGKPEAEKLLVVAAEGGIVLFSRDVWYPSWWSLVDMFDEGEEGRAILIGEGSEWAYRELGTRFIDSAHVVGDEAQVLTSDGQLHRSMNRGRSWWRTSIRKAVASALGLSRGDRFDFGFMRMKKDYILVEVQRKDSEREWKGSSVVVSQDLGKTFTPLGGSKGIESSRRILSIDFP